MSELVLSKAQYLEFEKISINAFLPLQGFMNEDEFYSCVNEMRLPNGHPFTIPVILDINSAALERLRGLPRVALIFNDKQVGELQPESFYIPDKQAICAKVFGTTDPNHPGVRFFASLNDVFVGGPVKLHQRATFEYSQFELTPEQTRKIFSDRGWKTIVGFQTRNVPHRAHEYLQRVGLEITDGLFIQPLVGRKKRGDFTPEAIMEGYQALIAEYYPRNRVVLGMLSTWMRYAGPREAVFHAIIRRNYGCTHFIIGRDHAGVGNYYGLYEAHDLARKFEGELGIQVLYLHGPYYCARCDGIVTEQTCRHHGTNEVTQISGTQIRAILIDGAKPDSRLMRPTVIRALRDVQVFIEEEDV